MVSHVEIVQCMRLPDVGIGGPQLRRCQALTMTMLEYASTS